MNAAIEPSKLKPLDPRELVIGRSLPANLYDQTGNILIRGGEIMTRQHDEALAAKSLCAVYVGPDWVSLPPPESDAEREQAGGSAPAYSRISRRRFQRREWRVPVTLHIEERTVTSVTMREISATTCDLSAGGFAFMCDRYLHAGTRVRMQLRDKLYEARVRNCVYFGKGRHRVGAGFTDDQEFSL